LIIIIRAKNLTEAAKKFHASFEKHVDFMHEYNSRMLYNQDPIMYHKLMYSVNGPFHHDYGETSIHERGKHIGYWTYKPFIINQQLSKLKDGEILFWHDVNVEKYPYFHDFEKPLKPFLFQILQKVGADIFIPFERPDQLSQLHVKKRTFEVLGEYNDKYLKWPHLNANRILIKKSNFTTAIVKEWMNACLDRTLNSPETEDEPGLQCHTYVFIYFD
jgi:hypothetical protein